jgi:salicylate hydroxylase
VALLGDAAHLMLQYMAQGAAMAMEDAVALGVACDGADGDFEKAFKRYQEMRVVRASRVHISANSLIGQIFHVPDGLQRRVRNDIFRGRSPERYYDALEWVFAAPDYVREFKAERRPSATKARAQPLKRAAARKRRPPSRQRG